jgi:hypothetical protein
MLRIRWDMLARLIRTRIGLMQGKRREGTNRGDNRDGIRGVKFRPPQLPIF